jgi:hypothetical protein
MRNAVFLTYASGEPVLQGDRILYAGKPGVAEFLADSADHETAWYVERSAEVA